MDLRLSLSLRGNDLRIHIGRPAVVATSPSRRHGVNREYAALAVRALLANFSLAKQGASRLWKIVLAEHKADPSKAPNSQMDVVLALWNGGYISIGTTSGRHFRPPQENVSLAWSGREIPRQRSARPAWRVPAKENLRPPGLLVGEPASEQWRLRQASRYRSRLTTDARLVWGASARSAAPWFPSFAAVPS